jgi:fatty acid desaturase
MRPAPLETRGGAPVEDQFLWLDLIPLSRAEKAWELLLPFPWLLLSLWCYGSERPWLGVFPSFYFFLTGLRQSHQAQHYTLGLPRRAQDWVLWLLSTLMLASMHAVQVSHLRHHKKCLDADDDEGAIAKRKWWQALLEGPLFLTRMHFGSYRQGTKAKRKWILAELAAIGVVAILGWRWGGVAAQLHLAAMLFGECLTGFFAVWTVHHGCAKEQIARTQRGILLNMLFYKMFLHKEHHMYPQVPTAHLDKLADRLDAREGRFAEAQVFPALLARNTSR